ncbi:MAG: alanine racemase [Alphaproteobacteria bacterium]
MTAGWSGATLSIDLDAIAANWQSLRCRLAPGASCAAAVKADAYGLGAAQVASRLHAEGCRDFFVARLDEGVRLRQTLPDSTIYVLDGVDRDSAGELIAHDLVPALNHLGQVEAWREAARRGGATLPAALHIDTGMNRLGLEAHEAARLADDASLLAGLDVRHAMSHLVNAEVAGDPLNAIQRERFRAAAERLRRATGTPQLSLANSSGIFLGPDYHFSMVRPGVALYGANPTPNAPNPMAEVVRLTAKILQVRRVDTTQTVGYGATHRPARASRIATVAAGYADGYLRSASNRAQARLGGLRVPVVGRVSMDLITLDVTDLPESLAVPGAEVELIGGDHGVDRLAEEAGTIGYEILTALGRRYRRHYLGAAS